MAKPKTIMSSYVRSQREAMGLSQLQFSRLVGVYQSYVSLVEKGEKIIDPVSAARWAKKMGLPQQDFVQIALTDWFRKEKVRLRVSIADLRGNDAIRYETTATTKRAKANKKTAQKKRVTTGKTTNKRKRALNAENPRLAKRAKQSKKSDQPKRATAKKKTESAERAVKRKSPRWIERAHDRESPVVQERVDNVTEFPTSAVA